MPNQTVKNGVKVKKIKLPQLNFHVPISLSHSTKLKEILEPIQSYEDVPFLGPKCPICPEQYFLVKTIIITFICLTALAIVQNLKKHSYSGSKVMRMHHFLVQNGSFAPNNFLFGKLLISLSSNY